MRYLRFVAAFVLLSLAWSCSSKSSPTGPSTNCAITVPQTTIDVGFTASTQNIFASTAASCTFTVSTNQPFITITSATTQTGPGSVTFAVAENNGAARQATVTLGTVAVTVNQAAGPPPIVFGQPTLPAATVGAAYAFQFTASGGQGALRYTQQSGTFLPQGLSLDSAGRITGTPVAPGTSTFTVCVGDDTSRTVCRAVNLIVNPPGTTDHPVFGNWAGSISVSTGCFSGLPRTVTWSGTFRRAADNSIELVASIPAVGVSNATVPVTITGNTVRFSITVDSRYDFTADFSADFRALTGTFGGQNCAPAGSPAVTPGGTWNGTKQ
jgi:hypothetical protein